MNRAIALVVVGILLAWVFVGGGCASKQSAAGEPEPFIKSYQNGTYSQAYDEAVAAHQRSDGVTRERAGLMAGLSAYALRRPEQAENWLIPLLSSRTPEVSGTANWTLGLIAFDRGNPSRAATLATTGADKLTGDDAARARLLAADAYARLGRSREASEQLAQALPAATDPALRGAIESRLAGGAPAVTPSSPITGSPVGSPAPPVPAPAGQYVIQLGAFSSRIKADQVTVSARGPASQAGLTSPKVVTTTDPKTGKPLFAAQIGPFGSRPEAEKALRRLGVPGTVMLAHR